MVKVQLRDATNPERVLEATFTVPFDPQDGSEIRVRDHARTDKHRAYRIIRHFVYEAVIGDPHESGVALLVTRLPS